MPVAIALFFLTGLCLSLFRFDTVLTAFFLSLGLTSITYAYLGGREDSSKSEGSGSFGKLFTFKVYGSIVSFIVTFWFLNYHLSKSEEARQLTLENGPETVDVKAFKPGNESGGKIIGSLQGKQIANWAGKLSLDDYFHPALVVIRRTFCVESPEKCIGAAGFIAQVVGSSSVPPNKIVLCGAELSRSFDSIAVNEALESATESKVLSNLLIERQDSEGGSPGRSIRAEALWLDAGIDASRCRRIKASASDQSGARIVGVMNALQRDSLSVKDSEDKRTPITVRVSILPSD
ncbi:MAG: hypothetical protein ACK6BG_00705 [Cyanobacteriota bacterium]